MKSFIAALRHATGVICAPLYGLLSFLFLWGGLILMGQGSPLGSGNILLVLVLFMARFTPAVRRMDPVLKNLLWCLAFAVYGGLAPLTVSAEIIRLF